MCWASQNVVLRAGGPALDRSARIGKWLHSIQLRPLSYLIPGGCERLGGLKPAPQLAQHATAPSLAPRAIRPRGRAPGKPEGEHGGEQNDTADLVDDRERSRDG